MYAARIGSDLDPKTLFYIDDIRIDDLVSCNWEFSPQFEVDPHYPITGVFTVARTILGAEPVLRAFANRAQLFRLEFHPECWDPKDLPSFNMILKQTLARCTFEEVKITGAYYGTHTECIYAFKAKRSTNWTIDLEP